MSSGDFMNLTFRNTTTYRPDGSFIPEGYIFTVSTNGRQNWTNSLRLDNLTVSTFTLNSTFNVASTNTSFMTIFSTLTVSSTETRTLTYSTLVGDSISTNRLFLNSSLTVTSTFAALLQTSTILGSTLQAMNGSISSLLTAQLATSSLFSGTLSTQNALVQSSLTTSTLVTDNTSGRLATYTSLYTQSLGVSTLLATSSLTVSGSMEYSTLSGSTLQANGITVQSTLVGSTFMGSTLVVSTLRATLAEMSQLTVLSSAVISSAAIQTGTFSTLTGSALGVQSMGFSTLVGSTLTLNTIRVNSSLTTSSFVTGSMNLSTLIGSTVLGGNVTVYSTLTVSTTETARMVVNRQPGTAVTSAYKLQIDQGQGLNDNGLFITNSNYGSDQGLSIGMVNEGFSYFGTYAKIQGKRSGSAGVTNVVLQPDAGKVGIGTTNPDALVDIYAPRGTPGTMFLYNGATGTNTTGGDLTVAAFNMGTAGSGLYYDSIRIRIPNGSTTSAAQMDFCTPAGITDNTQVTRLTILPYSGNVGIGSAAPAYPLDVVGDIRTTSGLRIGTRYHLKTDGTQVGIYDYTTSAWCITFDNSMNCTLNGDLTVNGKITVAQTTSATAAIHFKNQYDTGYLVMYGAAGGHTDPTVYFNTSDGTRGIMSGVFQAGYSDHRLKKNIQALSSNQCLEYINQFEAYQFDFVDKTHGQNDTIGFMASDVQAILPTLVNERVDYLPNLMEPADVTHLADQRIGITLSQGNDAVQLGVSIKLLDPRTFRYYIGELIRLEEGRMTLQLDETMDPSLERVIVYGTQVPDVKTLNYHSIFSMAVGAIKELHRKNLELENRMKAIEGIVLGLI